MMKRPCSWPVLASLLLSLTGCFSLTYNVKSNKPVLANREVGRPHELTQHFKDYSRRVYLFWGMAPVAGRNGTELIRPYADAGDGIVNLSAYESFDLLDGLVSLLTVGIVSSRQVQIEGDVFEYRPRGPAVGAAPATPQSLPGEAHL